MWLLIVLAAVVVVVVLVFYFLRPRAELPESDDEEVEVATTTDPPIQKNEKTVSIHGRQCSYGDFCIDGTSSARPGGMLAERLSCYIGSSVTTFSHPFLMKSDGMGYYMPLPAWWAMADCIDCCVGFLPDEVIFLTDNGLFSIRPGSFIRLSTRYYISGKNKSELVSIHNYGDSLYAVIGTSLYHLLSGAAYTHYYSSVGRGNDLINLAPQSKTWPWTRVQFLRGRDISTLSISSVIVYKPKKGISETIHLCLTDGNYLCYSRKRWHMSAVSVVGGWSMTVIRRGVVELISTNAGVSSLKARGTVFEYSPSIAPILYSIDGESWLYSCSTHTGMVSLRLSRGWSALRRLEDGRVIGILTGETFHC